MLRLPLGNIPYKLWLLFIDREGREKSSTFTGEIKFCKTSSVLVSALNKLAIYQTIKTISTLLRTTLEYRKGKNQPESESNS